MEQKTLSKWLKLIIIGVGICGLVVYLLVIPSFGRSLTDEYPEFSNRYLPWLIFLWATGIPCYAALFLGWRISTNIEKNQSFSHVNAKYLKWISCLAAIDSIFFFIGNVVLLLVNMNHPGIILLSLMVVFAGFAVTIIAATLSHLVQKAAALQEENDLTI